MAASIVIAVLMILFLVFWMVLKIRKKSNKDINCNFCNNSGIVGGCPCPKCLDPRGPFFD